MSRAFRNEIPVGRHRQTQENGDVYISERRIKYDPATQKTQTIGKKPIDKIPKEETTMVPTRPKKPAGSKKRETEAEPGVCHAAADRVDGHPGAAGAGVGNRRRHPGVFPGGDTAKLLSEACYWVATGGHTLPPMATWQIMHPVPYPGVSAWTCSATCSAAF